MDIVKSFWYHIIEVDYFPSLSYNLNSSQNRDDYACGTFQVSRTILDNPIPNKDFGVLIEAKDDGDSQSTAYSFPCAMSIALNKPTWGLMHWNKFYMNFTVLSFQ